MATLVVNSLYSIQRLNIVPLLSGLGRICPVSKQLNIEDNSYKIVLSAKKKKPVFFHFSVEEKCNYRLFDPEDYAYGFRIVPENTKSLVNSLYSIQRLNIVPLLSGLGRICPWW
jgi:predicted peptidase